MSVEIFEWFAGEIIERIFEDIYVGSSARIFSGTQRLTPGRRSKWIPEKKSQEIISAGTSN